MSDKGKSMWLRFFRNAGIPSGFDTKYALIFDENRIKMDMLMDINKECLRDMGITAMGDIIAILKHAKNVYDESKAQAYDVPIPTSSTIRKTTSGDNSTSPSSGSSSSSASGPRSVIINTKILEKPNSSDKEKTAPARLIVPKINNPPAAGFVKKAVSNTNLKTSNGAQVCDSTGNGSKKNIVRLKRSVSPVQREEVPVQKKTRVLPEQEGGYKIKMPEGTTARSQKLLQDRLGPTILTSSEPRKTEKKTSVFDRLGGDARVSSSSEPTRPASLLDLDVKMPEDPKLQNNPSVFARLGQGINSPGGSNFLKTKFEVKQSVTLTPEHYQPRTKPNPDVYREKTLTTIHSKISRPVERTRESSYERRSDSSSSGSGSKMRSAVERKDNSSVKSRLGIRSSTARSRSPSFSPPPSSRKFSQSREPPTRKLASPTDFRSQRLDLSTRQRIGPTRHDSQQMVARQAAPKVKNVNTSGNGGKIAQDRLYLLALQSRLEAQSAQLNKAGGVPVVEVREVVDFEEIIVMPKVVPSTVVKSRNSSSVDEKSKSSGQILSEERYRNPQGKLMLRRTILKRVPIRTKPS